MLIKTETGRAFELSALAIAALKKAHKSHDVNVAFDRYAPHVADQHRLEVWLAV